MARSTGKSLELWEKYGRHVLMAMPYADNLIGGSQGAILHDLDGNQILDFAAGQFCSILGNSHPKYVERLTEQLKKVVHVGSQFLSPVVLEAAAKFADVAPGQLSKAMFLSTGTEANECAISLAKTYTGKRGVIGFNRGYYGLSLGTKSLTAIFSPGDKHGSGPSVPETFHFLAPHCFHCPVNSRFPECDLVCLEASIEAALPRTRDIAAIIIEPIISAGGMIIPPPGYLKRLKSLAEEMGALLIIDEAQTGFGRTGRWFACEHHDVVPDILVVSKSCGSGFPVSGVITTDEIADQVAERGWLHLASHQLDPLPAAAVAATIDVVREENLVGKAAETGAHFMGALNRLKAKHSVITDVRGQGLMIGAEIGNYSEGSEHELCMLIVALCESMGVHFTYSYYEPVLRFLPPLNVTAQEVDRAVSVLDQAIGSALKGDVDIDDLLATNRYSRAYIEKLSGRKTLGRVASLLYETSPRYWLQKAREAAGKP
ncbi:MAG TPA: aspartate aminotransferase family protein [Candidatus Binatia bacterium]|nr:aspartate aminotransferase family protein [Candidatus Binatia bacterium]